MQERKKENNTSPISPEELRESKLKMFKWCQEAIKINTVDQKLMSKPDEQGLLTCIWKIRKHQIIAKWDAKSYHFTKRAPNGRSTQTFPCKTSTLWIQKPHL